MAPGQTAVSTWFWKLGPCSWQRMNLWPGADNLPFFFEYTFLLLRWERISRCLVILQRRDSRSSVNHEKRRRLLGGQSVLLLLVRCKNQLLVIRNNKKQTRFFSFFLYFLFVPLKGQDLSHDVELHCFGIGRFAGPIRLLGYDFEWALDNFLHLLFGSRIGSQHQTEKAWKMGRQVFCFFSVLSFFTCCNRT